MSNLQAHPARQQPAALVVAHPGHELRVHGWLERDRPIVHVLTDGSGRTGQSRLGGTERILDRAGATRGSVFGRFTDATIYAAVLNRETGWFIELAEELAETLRAGRIRCVVGDACEGYNPAHDVCRAVLDTAVALVRASSGQRPRCYDFPLIGRPDLCAPETEARAIWIRLDPEAFDRKVAAAHAFPELAGELASAVEANGIDSFRIECLRPARARAGGGAPPEAPPYYERYGAQQVEAGHYRQVLRYREHVLPLQRELRQHVLRSAAWTRSGS